MCKKKKPSRLLDFTGASGGIRTPDPRLRRPLLYPTELLTRLVGMTGFEPATSCSQSRRATKLRYIPVSAKRTNHNEYYTHPARRCQESIADNIRPTTTSSGNRPLSSAIAFRKLTAHHFLHELDGTAADASLPSHIRGRPAGEE